MEEVVFAVDIDDVEGVVIAADVKPLRGGRGVVCKAIVKTFLMTKKVPILTLFKL